MVNSLESEESEKVKSEKVKSEVGVKSCRVLRGFL
jgi:hypothetical protein